MKKLYPFISLIFTLSTSSAQTYTVSPSHTLYVNAVYNTISIFDIFQENISNDTIYLEWELISNDLVPGWDFSLCDYGSCYAGIPSFGFMDTVFAGGQGFLGLNIDPHTIEGTGTLRIYVYESNASSAGDTLTWVVTAGPNGTVAGLSPSVSVYPNPATDFVTIDMRRSPAPIVSITVLNMLGQQVAEKAVSSGLEQFDIRNLPEGTYLLLLNDENGVRHTSSLIK